MLLVIYWPPACAACWHWLSTTEEAISLKQQSEKDVDVFVIDVLKLLRLRKWIQCSLDSCLHLMEIILVLKKNFKKIDFEAEFVTCSWNMLKHKALRTWFSPTLHLQNSQKLAAGRAGMFQEMSCSGSGPFPPCLRLSVPVKISVGNRFNVMPGLNLIFYFSPAGFKISCFVCIFQNSFVANLQIWGIQSCWVVPKRCISKTSNLKQEACFQNVGSINFIYFSYKVYKHPSLLIPRL